METLERMGWVAQYIKEAQEALQRIETGQTWKDWETIGKGLEAIRNQAMLEARTNSPVGRTYCGIFKRLLAEGRLGTIDSGTRCRLLEAMAHREQINVWLAMLPLAERLKVNHPDTILKKWKAATTVPRTSPELQKSANKAEQLAQQWKRATVEIRREFLDRISFPDLLLAMSWSLRTALQN